MAQLPLTDLIQQTSGRKRKQNTIKTSYGDGYEQIATWGVNAFRDEWSLDYVGLTSTQRNTLLNSYNTTTVWTWQAPGDSTTKNWRYTGDYSESVSGNTYSVKLNIRQVHTI